MSTLLLVLTAAIWGAAFVAQRAGAEALPAFSFNGLRFLLGALLLAPVAALRLRRAPSSAATASFRAHLLPSLACGTVLFLGSTLQQAAMGTTDPGKAGFLTALYILAVPLLQRAFGRPLRPLHLFCAALGTAGMALLCLSGGLSFAPGDLLLLLCALAFAAHILLVDRYAAALDPLALSALQFFVVGLLSIPVIFLHEGFPPPSAFRAAAIPFLYAAVFSCGVGYTLQVVAQRRVAPAVASLIMCLESVFALLAGTLLLHERHTPRELLGCLLLFAATLLAQLPPSAPLAHSSPFPRPWEHVSHARDLLPHWIPFPPPADSPASVAVPPLRRPPPHACRLPRLSPPAKPPRPRLLRLRKTLAFSRIFRIPTAPAAPAAPPLFA